ncbi:hypothetical protein Tco_1355078 [Tanacetum coccineum]
MDSNERVRVKEEKEDEVDPTKGSSYINLKVGREGTSREVEKKAAKDARRAHVDKDALKTNEKDGLIMKQCIELVDEIHIRLGCF